MKLIVIGLFVFGIGVKCFAFSNQLAGHPSPYLAMHGNDPVKWQEWSKDVFEISKKYNKLIYISVGYFSCHWCHVMHKEVYNNTNIANYINEKFIPVKVDRELEPGLDYSLTQFLQETQNRSGWPLNAFLTPDGNPLYASLYLPANSFMQMLIQLQSMWIADSEKLSDIARQEISQDFESGTGVVKKNEVLAIRSRFEEMALFLTDKENGGFGNQSRFPHAPQLFYLLDLIESTNNPKLKKITQITLNAMAQKGLYDHVESGFFRYTVDPLWSQPHFEKMLNDNAQLALLYLKAGKILNVKKYTDIGISVLDFMVDQLYSESGAMFASLSAIDDHGREGGYYLFNEGIMQEQLSEEELLVLKETWFKNSTRHYNHGFFLARKNSEELVADNLGWSKTKTKKQLALAMDKLRFIRMKRVAPVDRIILAGSNALAIEAFLAGAIYSGQDKYFDIAKSIKNYMLSNLWDDNRLLRSNSGHIPLGTVSINDYAYFASALLSFYEATGNLNDLNLAAKVSEAGWNEFYVLNGWRKGYQNLLGGRNLEEIYLDGAVPAPDAVLAEVSIRIASITKNDAIAARAYDALDRAYDKIQEKAFFYPSRIKALEIALEAQKRP